MEIAQSPEVIILRARQRWRGKLISAQLHRDVQEAHLSDSRYPVYMRGLLGGGLTAILPPEFFSWLAEVCDYPRTGFAAIMGCGGSTPHRLYPLYIAAIRETGMVTFMVTGRDRQRFGYRRTAMRETLSIREEYTSGSRTYVHPLEESRRLMHERAIAARVAAYYRDLDD